MKSQASTPSRLAAVQRARERVDARILLFAFDRFRARHLEPKKGRAHPDVIAVREPAAHDRFPFDRRPVARSQILKKIGTFVVPNDPCVATADAFVLDAHVTVGCAPHDRG